MMIRATHKIHPYRLAAYGRNGLDRLRHGWYVMEVVRTVEKRRRRQLCEPLRRLGAHGAARVESKRRGRQIGHEEVVDVALGFGCIAGDTCVQRQVA